MAYDMEISHHLADTLDQYTEAHAQELVQMADEIEREAITRATKLREVAALLKLAHDEIFDMSPSAEDLED